MAPLLMGAHIQWFSHTEAGDASCAAGEYKVWYNTTAGSWRECIDGVLGDHGGGGGGGGGEANTLGSPDVGADVDLINSVPKTGTVLNLVSLEADDFSVAGNIVTIDDNSHSHTEANISDLSHFSPTDLDTDYIDQTVTSTYTFNDPADHEWSPQTTDLNLGDADEGQIGGGTWFLGQADDTVSTTVLDDIVILRNNAATLAESIAFIFFGPSDVPRFVIAEEGTDLATYNPRSLIVGPSATIANVDENVLCSTNFSDIDCNTGATGADLGVQDDVEIGGDLFLSTVSCDADNEKLETAATGQVSCGVAVDNNTNAETICTGTDVYLDGEGNCDTISGGGTECSTSPCSLNNATTHNGNEIAREGAWSGHRMVYWAEESGAINAATNGGFQYSYGNGNTNSGGVEMPAAGQVVWVSMDCEDAPDPTGAVINIVINRGASSACTITSPAGAAQNQQSTSATCSLAFSAGDQLTPKTVTSASTNGDGCTVQWVVEFS